MKKTLLIIFISVVILIMPTTVLAHPGGLDSSGCHYCRTNCGKWGLDTNEYHCHSGNTYSNSKGEVYDKSGTKISNSNSNNNDSDNKDENVNNNNSTTEKPSSNNNNNTSNNSTTNTKPETSITKPSTSKPVEKSKDTSLEYIKINDQDILISDEMNYETSKKNIEIDVKSSDIKSLVEFDTPELKVGENEVIIKVTAEAGNVKEYKMIITRKEIQSTVVIKKFVFGSSEVKFENNNATIQKLSNETSFEYSYELSDESAKLLLYVNNNEVTKLENIKKDDIIKLVVVDVDDNRNIYEIKVTELSEAESAIINGIAYTIVGIILLSPAIIIGVIVYIRKKKKKK